MRMPDIRAGPAQILGILPGSTAEPFQRIGDVFGILGQVDMHHNPLITGKIGRFAHQVTADRERRARGDTHPAHRTFSWVVKAVYDANTITYAVFLIFY